MQHTIIITDAMKKPLTCTLLDQQIISLSVGTLCSITSVFPSITEVLHLSVSEACLA